MFFGCSVHTAHCTSLVLHSIAFEEHSEWIAADYREYRQQQNARLSGFSSYEHK